MGASVVSQGSKVLIVDDLLATGTTLCAMLSLLMTAGIALEDIQVAVVVELPYHGGRKYLHEQGFGRVAVDSLLVFEGQ
jgi:adenine/guanine phosphoribosyltransferase-like PRPP-binding protein